MHLPQHQTVMQLGSHQDGPGNHQGQVRVRSSLVTTDKASKDLAGSNSTARQAVRGSSASAGPGQQQQQQQQGQRRPGDSQHQPQNSQQRPPGFRQQPGRSGPPNAQNQQQQRWQQHQQQQQQTAAPRAPAFAPVTAPGAVRMLREGADVPVAAEAADSDAAPAGPQSRSRQPGAGRWAQHEVTHELLVV